MNLKLEDFQHWQDTDTDINTMKDVFAQIPVEHQEAVLWLMGAARRCGALNESDNNNPDL